MVIDQDLEMLNMSTRGVSPCMTISNFDPFSMDSQLKCLISIAGNFKNELFDFEEKKQLLLKEGLVKEQNVPHSSKKFYFINSSSDIVSFLSGFKVFKCVYPVEKFSLDSSLSSILHGYGFNNGVARKGCFPARILRFRSVQELRELNFECGNVICFKRDYSKRAEKGTFEDEVKAIAEAALQKRKEKSSKSN